MNRSNTTRLKCFVPTCKNTTCNSRNKLFVRVKETVKRKWCEEVNIEYKPEQNLLCCEDHLNLEEDLENYYYYKLMKGKPILKSSAKLRRLQDVPSCSQIVDHSNKVCHSCNTMLKNGKTCKLDNAIVEEMVFVNVEGNENEDAPEEHADIKSDPESMDICNGSWKEDDHMSDQNMNENDQNQDENDQNYSEEELVSISSIKSETSCINYEFIEDSPEEATENTTPNKILEKSTNKISNKKSKESDDEDYIPPPNFKIPKKCPEPINSDMTPKTTEHDTEIAIELENYKRTTRIGLCIFNDCIEDCVSLIPRTVRREMVIEHNIYIPLLSKVCEEHLQDQNWEDLALGHTTTLFTADHCQDLINIVRDACHTNLDFENIETVDSKLVRYWFDLNKGEFNRTFNCFSQLKRLKEPKTAFAIYLMHLQKTSMKRIALLLKMKEGEVKSRIMFVKDVVKCNTYKMFKEKFLKDD